MTPDAFITKWKLSELGERQAAQPHFLDLCRLLGEAEPTDPDNYCFERAAQKTSGRSGFADVFKRGHFAWEYVRKGGNLNDKLTQLQQYALALDNPPLLVVCDLERFLIVTNWTNTVSRRIELRLDDLRDARHRETLKCVLSDPDALKPGLTREQITTERAIKLAELARDLRAKGHHPERVTRFLVRLVFCMFAEDIGLLKNREIVRMLEAAERRPDRSEAYAEKLFRTMATGGDIDFHEVLHFDGGLFAGEAPMALPMDRPQLKIALEAARQDWSEIEPAIMGTLFVQGLDPKRMEDLFRVAGAKGFGSVTFRKRFEQYTDRDKIMKIVEPVIRRPLLAEWADLKQQIEAKLAQNGNPRARDRAQAEARQLYVGFLDRLGRFKVLDPACGSGNFLFLALHTLKDIELLAMVEAEAIGLHRELYLRVGPQQMLGIEISPFAVEIARASVWIGDLQWRRRNGFAIDKEPILQPLDTIERRDALIDDDGKEATWPAADVIVSNPPFLGVKLLYGELGKEYTDNIRSTYPSVSQFSDLVCWWFDKSRRALIDDRAERIGLVATNSIRGGMNRQCLDAIVRDAQIVEAWSDEPWTIDGAAVRVSLVCFQDTLSRAKPSLDGKEVDEIAADLTGVSTDGSVADLTKARRLRDSLGVGFVGTVKAGRFDIDAEVARAWLRAPGNPNGRPNADVLRPWLNSYDLLQEWQDGWVVDFNRLSQQEATYFELPFDHVLRHVKSKRDLVRRKTYRERWWQFAEPCLRMRDAIGLLPRCFVTPSVAKHRVFQWIDPRRLPDHQLIVFARDDDTTFGILHSRAHELWTLKLCTWLGVGNDPRYTPTTCLETFPFPEGLTPNLPAASYADDPRAQRIANLARRLNDAREAWLNPPDLVRREPEVVPGYPDRILPISEEAAKELKRRTLTNLYNQRPTWLDNLHRELDAAVAAAYGWPEGLSDQEILKRLFDLNQERAKAGR